jgi:3-oxoacyl-[acyl-carrier-protein] synthase-3
LQQEDLPLSDVGLFVFHQANAHMLQHLRDRLEISPNRFLIDVAETGNTVSSSIPLALDRAAILRDKSSCPLVLCGFGVGSSWGSCLLR